MATYYVNPGTGNDSSAGTSWAAARNTINGTYAAGDVIRVAKSPDPTACGNGTWTSGPLPAAKTISAATYATPIEITTSAVHGYSTGNVVQIYGNTTNTNANGFWIITYVSTTKFTLDNSVGNGTNGGGSVINAAAKTVLLDGAYTKVINNCDNLWTKVPAADVTCTSLYDAYGDWKEGYSCQRIKINNAGTGAMAYYTMPATQDLSAYKQVSFWAKSAAQLNDGDLSIKLCSDSTGTVAVNTLNVPYIPAGEDANSYWGTYCLDTSSALGSGINSIALYQNTNKGSYNFYLDSVTASIGSDQTASITLCSLISKNGPGSQDGTDNWFGVQMIKESGTKSIVALRNNYAALPTNTNTYWGATGSFATYKRETLRYPSVTSNFQPANSGTSSAMIYFEGGYDTSSSTQNGETFVDGKTGTGSVNFLRNYNSMNRISFVNYYFGPVVEGQAGGGLYNIYKAQQVCGCPRAIQNTNGGSLNTMVINNLWYNAIAWLIYDGDRNHLTNKNMNYNGSSFYNLSGFGTQRYSIYSMGEMVYNTSGGTGGANFYGDNIIIKNLHSLGNGTSVFSGQISTINCKVDDTWSVGGSRDCRLYNQQYNKTAGNHYVVLDGATITMQTVTQQNGSAWDFNLTSIRGISYPANFKIMRVRVLVPNKLHTVSVYLKNSHATNVTSALLIRDGQIGGVAETQVNNSADTNFNNISITFTPTEIGSVEIEALAWISGAAGHVYVDSTMTFSVAP